MSFTFKNSRSTKIVAALTATSMLAWSTAPLVRAQDTGGDAALQETLERLKAEGVSNRVIAIIKQNSEGYDALRRQNAALRAETKTLNQSIMMLTQAVGSTADAKARFEAQFAQAKEDLESRYQQLRDEDMKRVLEEVRNNTAAKLEDAKNRAKDLTKAEVDALKKDFETQTERLEKELEKKARQFENSLGDCAPGERQQAMSYLDDSTGADHTADLSGLACARDAIQYYDDYRNGRASTEAMQKQMTSMAMAMASTGNYYAAAAFMALAVLMSLSGGGDGDGGGGSRGGGQPGSGGPGPNSGSTNPSIPGAGGSGTQPSNLGNPSPRQGSGGGPSETRTNASSQSAAEGGEGDLGTLTGGRCQVTGRPSRGIIAFKDKQNASGSFQLRWNTIDWSRVNGFSMEWPKMPPITKASCDFGSASFTFRINAGANDRCFTVYRGPTSEDGSGGREPDYVVEAAIGATGICADE